MLRSIIILALLWSSPAFSQQSSPSEAVIPEKPWVAGNTHADASKGYTKTHPPSAQGQNPTLSVLQPESKEAEGLSQDVGNEGTGENPNDRRMTEATERMADATDVIAGVTKALGVLAFFTLVAMVVQTVLMVKGLWATKDSNDAAKESAEAAIIAADAAKRSVDMSMNMERAYVYMTIDVSGARFESNDVTRITSIICKFLNYGRTPANLINHQIVLDVMTKGEIPRPLNPSEGGKKYPQGIVINANGHRNEPVRVEDHIGPLLRDIVLLDRGDLYLHGWMRYADVFGQVHITGFCSIFDFDKFGFARSGGDELNYAKSEEPIKHSHITPLSA